MIKPCSVRGLGLGAVHLRTGRRLLRRRRARRQLRQSERVRRVRQRQLVVDDAVDEVYFVCASLDVFQRRPRLVVLETIGVEKLVWTRRAPLLYERKSKNAVNTVRLQPW